MTAPAALSPLKDLYDIGEIPPLGHVPEKMWAWAIRKERHGPPDSAMQLEAVPTWSIGDDEVLVLVMAAGVNYNGVWAALGEPISPFNGHKQPFHIAGSDASGIVWAVGRKVQRKRARRGCDLVHPGSGAATHAAAAPPDLGRKRLLHTHPSHRLSYAFRPCAAHSAPRR